MKITNKEFLSLMASTHKSKDELITDLENKGHKVILNEEKLTDEEKETLSREPVAKQDDTKDTLVRMSQFFGDFQQLSKSLAKTLERDDVTPFKQKIKKIVEDISFLNSLVAKHKELNDKLLDTQVEKLKSNITNKMDKIEDKIDKAINQLQQSIDFISEKTDGFNESTTISTDKLSKDMASLLKQMSEKASSEELKGIRQDFATINDEMVGKDTTFSSQEIVKRIDTRVSEIKIPQRELGGGRNVFILDEGRDKGILSFLDFTGAGVTVTQSGDKHVVDIPSSGGGTVGPGTINELAYFDTTTSIASLPVATYPSLTELSYGKGVTSAIQTQINAKAPSTSPTFATSVTGSYLTASELLITDGSKNIVSAPVATYPSLTELSYLKGVTSSVQTQLNAFVNGMIYKGNWDASAGTFPGGGVAQTGWFYTVSVGGTVDSVVFNIGDRLIATTDNASTTTYAGNWTALDATDAVTSVFARTGNVVATAGDYTAALITNTPAGSIAAVTVQAAIDELDAEKQPLDAQLTSLAGLSYTGNTLKVVRVNAAENAFELATVSASPGGADEQIQFNDGGVFGGDAGLTYNKTTDALTVGYALYGSGELFLGSDSAEGAYIQIGDDATMTHYTSVGQYAYGHGAGIYGTLSYTGLTSNKTFTFPNTTGTIALTSDLSTYAPKASPTFTGTVILPKTIEIQDTSADHQYVLAVSELTADRTVTLPLLTASDEFVFKAHTQTLTNKRVTKRITSISSSGTPTINTDNCDCVTITALAEAITSMTTNLTGTPSDFDSLVFRIKDNGTARAITWGASFEAKGVALPTTTVLSKVLTVGFIWDAVTSKWGCVASAQEA